MEAVFGGLAVVLVALVGGAVTWLVARRSKSGTIDTSEAAELWESQTNYRKELLERLQRAEETTERLQVALQACSERVQAALQSCNTLREEVVKATELIVGLRRDVEEKNRQIEQMRREKQ